MPGFENEIEMVEDNRFCTNRLLLFTSHMAKTRFYSKYWIKSFQLNSARNIWIDMEVILIRLSTIEHFRIEQEKSFSFWNIIRILFIFMVIFFESIPIGNTSNESKLLLQIAICYFRRMGHRTDSNHDWNICSFQNILRIYFHHRSKLFNLSK